MTTSLVDAPRALLPLHEVEAAWKAAQRPVEPYRFLTVDCACGGEVRSWNDEAAITRAVTDHNDDERHVAWAIAHGWRDA